MTTEWAPIDKAARALGVSARTLKRRVAVGAVPSKLEKGRRLVSVPVGTIGPVIGPIVPPNGTVGPVTKGQKAGTNRENEREIGPIVTGPEGHLSQGQQGQQGQQRGTEGPNAVAHLIEQRERDRAEITFLRGLIEQHQRSEAELRASLREALKAMPKALTAGADSGELGQNETGKHVKGHGDTILPIEDIYPHMRPENRANGPRDGATVKGRQNDGESSISFGSIADWLEKEMNG